MAWQKALQDPSLMRLGDWLTRQISEEKLAELEEDGVTKRVMEEKYMKDEVTKTIVMVEDPNKLNQPFIQLWAEEDIGQTKKRRKTKKQVNIIYT